MSTVKVVHQHELDLGVGAVVGAVEIAERLGVLPQTVSQWVQRAKGKAGTDTRAGRRAMPPPRWTVSTFPAWYWPDVETWAKATGRLAADQPAPVAHGAGVGGHVARFVGGPLGGQHREFEKRPGRDIVVNLHRGPNLLEASADNPRAVPVRSTYRYHPPNDPDGARVYLHHETVDLADIEADENADREAHRR